MSRWVGGWWLLRHVLPESGRHRNVAIDWHVFWVVTKHCRSIVTLVKGLGESFVVGVTRESKWSSGWVVGSSTCLSRANVHKPIRIVLDVSEETCDLTFTSIGQTISKWLVGFSTEGWELANSLQESVVSVDGVRVRNPRVPDWLREDLSYSNDIFLGCVIKVMTD